MTILADDFTLFFTAIGPGQSSNSAQLYGVTMDDRVVEVMIPSRMTDYRITADESVGLALDELGWAVLDGSLTWFWSGTHYDFGQYSGSDTYVGQISGDGRLIPVAAELPNIIQVGFSDSVVVEGTNLYAQFGDVPGQYWRFDTDLSGSQITGFSRPNAYGAQGGMTAFGEVLYFFGDQQTPLGTTELWRILPGGTVEVALNITSPMQLTDLHVFDGDLWVVGYGYSGEGPRMFRFDTPTGAPQELSLPPLISPWGFVEVDGGLHLLAGRGLYPLSPDGSLGDNMFTTLTVGSYLRELVVFDGDIYVAADLAQGTVLARLNDDGTVQTVFEVPGTMLDSVESLTVHEGALYFEAALAVDDGYGGIEYDLENLYRLDADGTITLLAGDDFYAIGTLIPFSVSVPGPEEAQYLEGTDLGELIRGYGGNDTILGHDGNDTLDGGDGDDVIVGGTLASDLRDNIYGGNGNDSIDGGHGNDELRGDAGNDTILGGAGVDTIIGGAGDDVLTGQTWSDVILGGDGMDFINGGFGHDRLNGGADADRFYHLGVEGHGSDWVQDFSDTGGDVLVFGGTGSISDFQVNVTETEAAGQAGVEEAFVIHKPTQQILWALVDGAAQEEITILIGGTEYDLLG